MEVVVVNLVNSPYVKRSNMNLIKQWLLLVILSLCGYTVQAEDNCCFQPGNVCGDKCCDGTPLPEECGNFKIIQLPPASTPQLTTAKEKETKPKTTQEKEPPKRLYVWKDPNTEATYFSSAFPPWYRNTSDPNHDKYPRVLVFDEYNRVIDDTGNQDSNANAEQKRKEAELLQQQQEAAKKKAEEEKAVKVEQVRSAKMLQEWLKTGKLTEELKQLLEKWTDEGKVTPAMTEEQVKKVWGEPQTIQPVSEGEKSQTIWTYANGTIVTLLNGRVSSWTKKP